jgi:hypothetical protein
MTKERPFQIIYSAIHSQTYQAGKDLSERLAELQEQTGTEWEARPDDEHRIVFRPKENEQRRNN